MKKEDIELQKAEQQICGFYHAYQGYSLSELVKAMGLTKAELKKMLNKGMLNYLPEELGEEIIEAIK